MKRTNRKIFPFMAGGPSSSGPASSAFDFLVSHFGQNFDALSFATAAGSIGNTTSSFMIPCFLELPIKIGHCTINVQTVGGAGSQMTVGYYAMTGLAAGSLVVSSTFNTSTGQATGNRTNAVSLVTLPAGWYWYAWATNETATTTFITHALSAFLEGMLNAVGNQVRCGQRNPAVAGTLDSAFTGLPTASNFGAAPASVWEL